MVVLNVSAVHWSVQVAMHGLTPLGYSYPLLAPGGVAAL